MPTIDKQVHHGIKLVISPYQLYYLFLKIIPLKILNIDLEKRFIYKIELITCLCFFLTSLFGSCKQAT